MGTESEFAPIHSDFPYPIIPTPQANGGIKANITTHMIAGNSRTLMEGERDLGNMAKNKPT